MDKYEWFEHVTHISQHSLFIALIIVALIITGIVFVFIKSWFVSYVFVFLALNLLIPPLQGLFMEGSVAYYLWVIGMIGLVMHWGLVGLSLITFIVSTIFD